MRNPALIGFKPFTAAVRCCVADGYGEGFAPPSVVSQFSILHFQLETLSRPRRSYLLASMGLRQILAQTPATRKRRSGHPFFDARQKMFWRPSKVFLTFVKITSVPSARRKKPPNIMHQGAFDHEKFCLRPCKVFPRPCKVFLRACKVCMCPPKKGIALWRNKTIHRKPLICSDLCA